MRVLGSERCAHNTTQRIDDSSSDIPALPADHEARQDNVTDLEWTKETILQTSRLFARNLSFPCTDG